MPIESVDPGNVGRKDNKASELSVTQTVHHAPLSPNPGQVSAVGLLKLRFLLKRAPLSRFHW